MYLRTILCLWIMTEYIYCMINVWCIDNWYYIHFHPTSIYPISKNSCWGGGIGESQCCSLSESSSGKPQKWFSNSESERCWRVLGMFQGYVWFFFFETSWRCWKILETGLKLQVASWSLTKVAFSRETWTNIVTKKYLLDFFGLVFWTWVNGFGLVEIS